MRPAVIAGVGMTAFGRFPERSLRQLAREAAEAAVHDAGLTPADVQLLLFGNAGAGLLSGQEMIRAEAAFAASAFGGIAMINVENACGSSSSAVHLAWMAVASGAYDVVLAVGAEKLSHPDKRRPQEVLGSAIDLEARDALTAAVGEGGSGALMMDIYADLTRRYMARSGATRIHLADVAVKNRGHASLNPLAQYPTPVSREEVLASRTIAGPITLLMCSPIGDGAAALLICSEAAARRAGADTVRLRGTAVATGVPGGTPRTPAERAAAKAYEMAGIGPEDIHIAELHDAAAPAELIHCEELGLCGPGEAAAMLERGDTRLGGRLPLNVSGGLIGRGHPVGATGCAQLVELVGQLRGRAGRRQVAGARVGVAENQGGYLHPDPAVAVVTVLSRD